MPKKVENKNDEILNKLEYLGLDLDKLPKAITNFEELEYRIPKFYEENKYRQYRYVDVKDIKILITPTNRLDELEEKYKKASPIFDYLDNKTEENYAKHAKFLEMLKNVKIEDIEQIEEEQKKLNKQIPFKVKFASNYLWQIYYSKNTDKYFMLVPTEDAQYAAFFYILKKKLEKGRTAKIFVPINGVEYTTTYLKKSEFQDIENYMWLFTKDWPLVYEVFDKKDNLSIEIVGETRVYEKIKSKYNIKLESKEEACNFYKLIKAMFILQTDLPNYYNFQTNISKEGGIEFYTENRKIEYKDIPKWLKEEYILCNEKKKQKNKQIETNSQKLEDLKTQSVLLEMEYVEKEKQISTFLECRKTFFGRVKYYFKYSKAKKNKKVENEVKEEIKNQEDEIKEIENDNIQDKIKDHYTIEELMQNYKEYELKENNLKNIIMDINALKLKNKNLEKKIENASIYIKDIDSHKKSIFEFWKYSNKDEVSQLPEGEAEEINVVKKITKVFDYDEDIEYFGKKYDRLLRKELTQDESDALFITNTNVIDLLNQIKTNTLEPKELENYLKMLKKEAIEQKSLLDNEEFDIFGGIADDSTKIKKIKDKKHRELPKDKFKILDINKNTKQIGFKLILEQIIDNIKNSLEKSKVEEDMAIYKAIADGDINKENINIFNINPEIEIEEKLKDTVNSINLYKININGIINAIPFTNIIFYDNQNKTLPIGMDLSTKILIDLNKLELEEVNTNSFNIAYFENEKDEFSKVYIKHIKLIEYNIKTAKEK